MKQAHKQRQSPDFEIVHTGDLHTGACRFAYDYLNRHAKAFKGITAYVRKRKQAGVNVIVVIAGDLLDRKTITEDERNLALGFVVGLVKLGVHVVVINGNHDFYNEDGVTMIHPLHIMQSLCPKYLHVVTDNPDVVNLCDLDVSFVCVPCQQDLTTTKLMKLISGQLSKVECTRRYGVVHEAINGSLASDNHVMKTSCDLPDTGLDGILLGDIHKAQRIGKSAWYCGSPLQIKSNEDPYKGFLVWKSGVEDPELVILKHVPRIITVTSEKALRKYEGTKHTVKYVGKKRVESEAVNVSIQRNLKSMVQKMNKKISQTVVEVTNNVTEGLEDWLKRKGAEADEVEEALGIVEEELTK